MRTTLSLDDDVAILIEEVRKSRDVTFKQVVNDALREGLTRIVSPHRSEPFETRTRDLGECFYPNLDNVWDVLDDAECSGTGR